MGLSVENQNSISIILILKWPASLPLPLICCGWHALGSFVTQTASHMRVGLTSVHQERQMTHLTTPFYNCRGFFLKLLQTRGMSENPAGQGRNEMTVGTDSSFLLFFTQLPPSFLYSFCLGNGLFRPSTTTSLLAQKPLHAEAGCVLG